MTDPSPPREVFRAVSQIAARTGGTARMSTQWDDNLGARVCVIEIEWPGDSGYPRPVPDLCPERDGGPHVWTTQYGPLGGSCHHCGKPARPVPEPSTKPCATCDGMGDVAVEFGETPLDYTTAPCSACGGSGVATTEGNET